MMRRKDLPVVLSHNARTGIMTLSNRKMGGRDVLIVGLNREVVSGESFDLEDIEWIKSVLNFSNIEALQLTVDVLSKELKRWESEEWTDRWMTN